MKSLRVSRVNQPTVVRAPFAGTVLLGASLLAGSAPRYLDPTLRMPVVVIPRAVVDSMTAIYRAFNAHWDELQDVNTLTQMLGTGKPTQLEYLGCFTGVARGDTVEILGLVPARGLKQFQFAVAGDCKEVIGLVGTWHTHPYRADPENHPLKERALSAQDLETFRQSSELRVTIVMWDLDSLDAGAKTEAGDVVHPAPVDVR